MPELFGESSSFAVVGVVGDHGEWEGALTVIQ